MTDRIDITPEERAIVLRILNEIVPDREVRAFGSRVTGKAKPFSDLDLVVMGDEPLSLETRARLEEAFSESDLPWKVDVLDWAQTEQGFKEAIKENSLPLTETHSTLIRNASNCMNTQYQHLSPNKLQLASLEELADNATGSIAIGPFGSRMKADCYVSSGMPVIRGTNLVHGRKWAGDWVYVPLELADTMPNCQVNAGDIVFPHRGAIGEVGIVPDDGNTYLISSSLMKIKLDRTKSEPDFIYYYFSSQAGREEILRFSSSVGTPGIGQPLTSMRQFKIPRFPLQVQKSIASILGALDDKIDLNRRTNETLEAMARALFRDSFVDFGPTRAKMAGQTPYLAPEIWELFPDRLDDEGKPEGWMRSAIGQEVNVVGGSTPSTKKPAFWNGDIFWATPKDLSSLQNQVLLETERKITEEGLSQISSGILPVGTVLLSSRAPIGYTAITQVPLAINQGFIAMVCQKCLSNTFVWLWTLASMETIHQKANGSTFQEISKANFRPIETIVPTPDLLRVFDEKAGFWLKKIVSNETESRSLAQLRDLLLPKLMSGEIRIRDAEKMVADAL